MDDKLQGRYRESLYAGYASDFKNSTGIFDYASADRWTACLRYYLREWLPSDRAARVIDLGCGDGRVIYCLGELGYRNVSGVDLSDSQLELARQVSSAVQKADVLDYLSESTQTADLIVSFDLIEHFRKEEALTFLEGCYTRLNAGGRLILQTPNAASPFFGAVRYGDLTHELAFTPGLLAQLMTRAGFSSVNAREMPPVPNGYSFKSTFRYLVWRCVRAVLGFIDLVETGSRGGGIYTRVFVISGVK